MAFVWLLTIDASRPFWVFRFPGRLLSSAKNSFIWKLWLRKPWHWLLFLFRIQRSSELLTAEFDKLNWLIFSGLNWYPIDQGYSLNVEGHSNEDWPYRRPHFWSKKLWPFWPDGIVALQEFVFRRWDCVFFIISPFLL